MMIGRGNPGRGPYYEGVLKLAPILAAVLFAVVALALAINFIKSLGDSETKNRPFDPAKHFSKINSRGMVDVLMKKRADQTY
jgi:hypothetical protein